MRLELELPPEQELTRLVKAAMTMRYNEAVVFMVKSTVLEFKTCRRIVDHLSTSNPDTELGRTHPLYFNGAAGD